MKGSKNNQNDGIGELERAYAKAFAEYLLMSNEQALHSAYQIGRDALAGDVSLPDMARMHHINIAGMVTRLSPPPSFAQDLYRAQQFFGECLSPYEMARRGFSDTTYALRRLNETLEQEIQRIAQSVHDEAGQLLIAARLAMDAVAYEVDPSLSSRLQEIGVILDQVENQLRRLSHELRPTILDDLGLLPALEFLAGRIANRANLSIRIQSRLRGRCSSTIETAVYRVVQEALTNITKHAQAKNVEIHFRKIEKKLHCVIHDDGVGFDLPSVPSPTMHTGLGLIGIRERLNAVGGTLQIASEVGRGTSLVIRIPWRDK